jgi:hypothetical protein
MSESSFNTIVVRDSRINDISTKADVIVAKGGAQNNYQHIKSNSLSTTNINVNVVVPSENTIVDRNVTITCTAKLKVTIPAFTSYSQGVKTAFSYGKTEALAQFPLNSMFNNSSVTINQSNTSVNTRDMLHSLLKMSSDESLNMYDCPHMSDKRFKKYSDMTMTPSNPLGSYNDSVGGEIPRGAHPAIIGVIVTRHGQAASARVVTGTDAGDIAFVAALASGNNADHWVVDITFTSTEPLLFLSPFIYGKNNNNSAGLYGIRNMDFVFNMDSSAKGVLCSGSANPMTVELTSFDECYINVNYLTTQASDLLASKNVVPYVDYARYITTHSNLLYNASSKIDAHAVQLNQIPNKIYIFARKTLDLQALKDSKSFLPISDISINFNNVSGILANANAKDLYNMSVSNGSKQDRYEFLGKATGMTGLPVATSGSIVIIDPSRDLNLPDYLSNGSIGQFSFQPSVTILNTEADAPGQVIPGLVPELVIICEYNGLFITQAGQSMKQTGLLTKDLVMNSTMSQFGESSNYIKSFNNGNGCNSNSTIRNIPLLNVKKAGGAVSGGAKSGGAMSGGLPRFDNCI